MNQEDCQKLTDKWKARTAEGVLEIEKIDATYLNGHHPFTIGTAHVVYAADHAGGMLTEDAIERSGRGCCAVLPGGRCCNRGWKDPAHKSVTACYIRVRRPCTQAEVCGVIEPLKDELSADGVDGFAFVNHQQITDWGQTKPENQP